MQKLQIIYYQKKVDSLMGVRLDINKDNRFCYSVKKAYLPIDRLKKRLIPLEVVKMGLKYFQLVLIFTEYNQKNLGTVQSLFNSKANLSRINIKVGRTSQLSLAKSMHVKRRIICLATMSAGKSTLINALLGQRLLPSSNEATTGKLFVVKNILKSHAVKIIAQTKYGSEQTLEQGSEVLQVLNENRDELAKHVHRVKIIGKFSNLPVNLELVDTPGPNNSQNDSHSQLTLQTIKESQQDLFFYILNATQLKTNDDKALLTVVKRNHLTGSNNIVFIINKLDMFGNADEIQKTLKGIRLYLKKDFDIKHPILICVSAKLALEIQTELADVSNSALQTINRHDSRSRIVSELYRFLDSRKLHLEKNAQVPKSIRKMIDQNLQKARSQDDYKMEALIHTGIPTLIAYIKSLKIDGGKGHYEISD